MSVDFLNWIYGGYSEEAKIVPILNTKVKPFSVDGAALEMVREERAVLAWLAIANKVRTRIINSKEDIFIPELALYINIPHHAARYIGFTDSPNV